MTCVFTHVIYTVNRNRVDLCLQASGGLRMCGSQTDRNTAQILVFLDDLLMFYQQFGVNLMWCVFAAGVCASMRACACIRTYSVLTGRGHSKLCQAVPTHETMNLNDVWTCWLAKLCQGLTAVAMGIRSVCFILANHSELSVMNPNWVKCLGSGRCILYLWLPDTGLV